MRNFVVLLLIFFISLPGPADASAVDGTVQYRIKPGDTLIDLASRYFTNSSDYRQVQKQNKIANPHRLVIGSTLEINRTLLKFELASAEIAAVRGEVFAASQAGETASQAKQGQKLREGAGIATSAGSFATLILDNGSKISLPSNSKLGILLLRKYAIDNSIDYDFAIGEGGARSTVTRARNANDRYRVRTPKAVSAVRGTDFQSRYDAKSGNDFAEVVEGNLAVGMGVGLSDMPLPAGNGLAVAIGGKVTREVLLPAPAIISPGKLQADEKIQFRIDGGASTSEYRVQIASDAGFVDQLQDLRSIGNQAQLAGLDDGNYFMRLRAISAAGIEGLPVTYAFKRRLNSVAGSVGKADNGYMFKWFGSGSGNRQYHFQLFHNSKGGPPMVDEPGLHADRVALSDLEPGDYYWRVGAVQFTDGELNENWTDFEKLTVGAP